MDNYVQLILFLPSYLLSLWGKLSRNSLTKDKYLNASLITIIIQIIRTRMDDYVQLLPFHPLKNKLDSIIYYIFNGRRIVER